MYLKLVLSYLSRINSMYKKLYIGSYRLASPPKLVSMNKLYLYLA